MRADQQSGTIAYLVTRDHRYTMDPFIADFGLDAHFDVIPYDEVLVPDAALPKGTVIFSDVDRLSKRERHAAIALADRLLLAGRRVLNHPANVLGRVELLRRLKIGGMNPFSIYRLVELANVRGLRYPVFVRTDREHSGACVDAEVSAARCAGIAR